METYALIGVIWMIGWLYACGNHYGRKEIVRKNGTEADKSNIDTGGWFQYVILLFTWPHYLGYNADASV